MVDTVAPGRLFLRVISFSAVIIIPPTLHIHVPVNVALNSDTNTRRLGNLLKKVLFWESESIAESGVAREGSFFFVFKGLNSFSSSYSATALSVWPWLPLQLMPTPQRRTHHRNTNICCHITILPFLSTLPFL